MFVKVSFTNRSLRVERKDLEEYLQQLHTDNQRHADHMLLSDIPPTGEIHQWPIAHPGGERCMRLCVVMCFHTVGEKCHGNTISDPPQCQGGWGGTSFKK